MEALGHVALPRFLKCAQHFPQSLAGFLKHVQHSPQSTLGHVVYGISITSASQRPDSLTLTIARDFAGCLQGGCGLLFLSCTDNSWEEGNLYTLFGLENVFGWFVRFDQMVGRRRDLCCSVLLKVAANTD